MQITTANLIKILPFAPEFRQTLETKYEALPEEAKWDMDEILRDYYYTLYDIKAKDILAKLMEQVEDHKDTLDNIYGRAKAQAEKELEQELHTGKEQTELGDVREKLQDILGKHGG